MTYATRLSFRLRCRLIGHLWYLAYDDAATHTATLRCGRCNPDGAWPRGEKRVRYREVPV